MVRLTSMANLHGLLVVAIVAIAAFAALVDWD
jgi:hypothetical protein